MIYKQVLKFIKLTPFVPWTVILTLMITSCHEVKNPVCCVPDNEIGGSILTLRDGSQIYIWENVHEAAGRNTVFIIAGITGINHRSDKDIIDILSQNENRVVVVHPRGTGYSEGARGDTDPAAIIDDHCEIIGRDSAYTDDARKLILFGHSMSCAIALEVAGKLPGVDGLILVNPPYRLKPARGMSPGLLSYVKYAFYYVFAPHRPVVDMAGDPSAIADASDRADSEQRNNDSLLVKYFSMRCMAESQKIMKTMVKNASKTDLPLLLLYGENDNIVDKSGCDEIYSAWRSDKKSYVTVKEGSHGKSTVINAAGVITKWIENCELKKSE